VKICIDPGHGGHDSGAVGPTGLRESDVALAVGGLCLTMALADDWAIMGTRYTDRFVGLQERADIANAAQVDLFVSIHCNGFHKPSAHGFEVWTTRGQTKADPVASLMMAHLGRALPGETARMDLADGDPDKEGPLWVLRETHAPAVLVELGFITHAASESRMRSHEWRVKVARAIIDAANEWRGG
jgi:N-acetylmuramoyl-L-alanine amidase